MQKNKRYILLFLLILLTCFGIWKCPTQSEDKSKIELAQPKEDRLKVVEPETILQEHKSSQTNKEVINTDKQDKPITSKSKKKSIPDINPSKINEESPKIKIEESLEREKVNPNEESPQVDFKIFMASKSIDKRSPASSDVSCKASTILNITKSSIQTSIAFSPDGVNFAVGNHNNYVSVLNMEGKELLKLTGHKGYVQSIKYSPDGNFMVTGSMDKTGKLWDARNGKEIKSLEGHTEGILSVAYSLNGNYIATGSLDHTTILWDSKSGKKLFQLRGHQAEIAEVAFSPNSKFIITGSSDGTAKVWDVESGNILYSLEGHDGVVGGVAFTPNEKLIATGSVDKIRLWNAKTGKHIHTINESKSQIMSIFISNDGNYISSSNRDGLIKIWNIKGGEKLCEYEGHSKRAREAVFHPTKKNTMVSASNDNTIKIWKFKVD